MRHLKSGRKLNRSASHRWALIRNLVTSLLRDERIRTTDPKAKELRRWADRVISLGKEGTLHARRQALGIVQDKAVVRKLFESIGPRFKARAGGYTRIIKIGRRHGDAAPISLVELVGESAPAGAAAGSRSRRRGRRSRAGEEAGATKKAPSRPGAKEPAA
jgi:large subunit ribosomal protein L17